ncbi:ATP-binding protein [Paraliomyxa miuraensis]|uniref:ATP-binding protein n=1 Tax=Paraliomyxa miuraensis TaxID=376150 RepID=UPI0022526659|nr:ATP-binding protein [Paraliomyxa miuraensis]MCX4245895.1 ATP-binding protein [Paraliomyxa miuraensis]
MSDEAIPDEILQRFRQLAAERLGRAESIWFGLSQGTGHDDDAPELLRLIHTLKGDAQMIGFGDVELVCHELENLMAVAARLHYAVPEDIDLLVTMSFHFIGLLARKRSGTSVAGIDLDGFVQEVTAAVAAAQPLTRAAERNGTSLSPTSPADASLDQRQRLARAAAMAFLEHLGARGASQQRLRELWALLRHEVALLSAVALGPLVERHLGAACELGEQLGKLVHTASDTRGLCVISRVADAVDVGLLHSIRNAIDHGIEPPEQRTAAGKPEHGTLRVMAEATPDGVALVVEDDGRGLDHDAIAHRAHALGFIADPTRASLAETREVLFRAGFSTARQTSPVSGRGVGLDAVRSALRKAGGDVSIEDRSGGGTRVVMRIPAPRSRVEVLVFEGRPGLSLAIPGHWTTTVLPEVPSQVLDPLAAFGIADPSPTPRRYAVSLRWGPLHDTWGVETLPRLTTATRICPTTSDDPMEVVEVDGHEVLALRPDRLPNLPS